MKFVSLSLSLILLSPYNFAQDSWPQYMGPNRDGSVSASGIIKNKVQLDRLWMEPLGSGFSGIAVGGGRLYVMHSSGEDDAMSCLDAQTGKVIWSFAYGPAFPKVGSSEPGPLSTPVLDGRYVYGLGARGELFSVDVKTGKPVWRRDLVKDLGGKAVETGFTSSPLVHGEMLILNLWDGKDKSVTALKKKTGELAWSIGDEKIGHQSPALITYKGKPQVVAFSELKMRGLDPVTGTVLWETDSQAWVQGIPISEGVFLTADFGGIALFELSEVDGVIKVNKKWHSYILTLNFDMPVHHKGHIYGFNSGLLFCLDLKTGKEVWASEKTGGGLAILVDGHLGMICDDGMFRLAKASEFGYDELAAVKVFEKSGLTEASYADGVFYVRNYTHAAAIRVK